MKLPMWLVLPLIIVCVLFYFFSGGSDNSGSVPVSESNFQEPVLTEPELPASEPLENEVATPSSEGQTWLVMLYQDADDKILEQDIFIDLNEAERVGSTDRVHIVAQMDRYKAGYAEDGNWASTRRYYLKKDDDLNRINSQMVQDLGEINMADGRTLIDFATWAIANFPSDKYVLILSDHGMGWPGGWSDPAPGGKDPNPAPIAARLGDHLFLNEIDWALGEIRTQSGIDEFEIVGFDACLMAQLEVFSAIEPHARYAIASEETEPALGWAYTGFLNTLIMNPDMSGEELSRSVIDSYIEEDQRIVDPGARADFASTASPLGGLFGVSEISPEQLTLQLGKETTLSAIDLKLLPNLMQRVNEFAHALQNEDQSIVASARNFARSYTSIFGREVPPSFIDLGNFVQLVDRESRNNDVKQSANDLLSALRQAVIAEKHGSGKDGSSGIAFYFPNSTLYSSPITGPQSYTSIANQFAENSLWDDFLAFHYHDRNFDELTVEPYIPDAGTPTRAPGQGDISVSAIRASSNSAAPGQPVDLSVDIRGKNIGYIKLFVGFYDQASNSIQYIDTDYLESPDTQELDGVYYPKWSESGDFTMKFSWDPFIFAISDGRKLAPSLFRPQAYGAVAEEAVYTVDGIYSFVDSSDERPAQIYFRDGVLRQIIGFTGDAETGAPREITPQTGDRFTIVDQWMDLDANGNVVAVTPVVGETLTFGSEIIRWEEVYAAPGEYMVGFIIEDLDGNVFPVYTQIIVE